ncbi:MAG TPA: single-stranded-DNA-specific exonuclease RecJ [Burkholderiales bacterium]|nr:single-stranded-DNA-specific exonuclease RecJ [Burkholderiales bacterium]
MSAVVARDVPQEAAAALVADGVPPLLARLYAARGIRSASGLTAELAQLAVPGTMLNLRDMAGRLADAIASRRKLLIVADYDADGATACAVGMRALRAFGAQVEFLVPNRFEYGYGLSPEIVRLARERFRPDILITVDNGIASLEGVAEASRLGMETFITDHHLPGTQLPQAACIINPNQPGCTFPSKHLAGVGVMFYLMLALRAELRGRGAFGQRHKSQGTSHQEGKMASPSLPGDEPNLADLLPLVALGTVADVVPLDHNNRILVHQGLARMRAGRMPAGIAALFQAAGCDPRQATARDLGFALGPRLNAAGRLTDMALGIECLVTDDAASALAIATRLDRLNRERRVIESGMQDEALSAVDDRDFGESYSLSLFDPGWHQGVIGIVAGRIKERFHRPAIAFARGNPGEIRGSGRSIPALHLRDALDQVAVRHPGLVLKFGGHAAAAGLTVQESDFGRFRSAFEETARRLLTPADLNRVIETDGPLEPGDCTLEAIAMLSAPVWGQGFPPPRFCNEFEVAAQRIVGGKHLKLTLRHGRLRIEAIRFNCVEAAPGRIRAVHQPAVNVYNGRASVQLNIEHWEAA